MPPAPTPLELSVVIPAYNEEERIGATLNRAAAWLEAHHPRHEVLVVDDGSTDGTVALVRSLAAQSRQPGRRVRGLPTVRLLGDGRNRGKGHAVRAGMLAARGERRLFMDADLSTPIEELDKLWAALDEGFDVAIGSRGLPDSDLLRRQSPLRERMGKTFNLLVRGLILPGFSDTQCGFKLFTGAAAEDLFGRATVDRFAFDVEILSMAAERYRVLEVPVRWENSLQSKVSPGRDALQMLLDVVRLRRRR